MKNIFPFLGLLILFTLTACPAADSGNDNTGSTTLVGKWALKEALIDIGNGQGTFEPVNSEKTIEFLENGKIISNGSLCQMTDQTTEAGEADYNTTEQTIQPKGCNFDVPDIRYEHNGNELILWYRCFEPCGHKFVKL